MAPKGFVTGTSHWLEAPGKTQDRPGYTFQLAWECFRIPHNKINCLARKKTATSTLTSKNGGKMFMKNKILFSEENILT